MFKNRKKSSSQDIYNLGPFPTGFLSDLRQKIQISENLKLKQLAVDQSKSSVCVRYLIGTSKHLLFLGNQTNQTKTHRR